MTGRHRDFLPILLGVCALVTFAGLINDEAIAAISPRHFNVYYPIPFAADSPSLQALGFTLVVAGGGFAWGSLLYYVGHYGPGPVVGPRATLLGAAAVVIITLAVAWGLGAWTWAGGQSPYSEFFYPTNDPRLCFSQTVQLTAEVGGLLGAGLWLAAIALWRWRKSEG